MGAPSTSEIAEMGFTAEMFGKSSDSDLQAMIKGMITEHGGLLSGRIGATAYSSTSQPTATYVKRTLKCLVAAELCQRRINRLAQEVKQEDGTDANKMRKQRLDYLAEAEILIGKIEEGNGASNDFASSPVVTSHFAEDA